MKCAYLSILFVSLICFIAKVHANFEDHSEDCNVPADVSYCIGLMHYGTKFDDETAPHFIRLQEQFENLSIRECLWHNLKEKMNAKACISRLSKFVVQNSSIMKSPKPSLRLSRYSYGGSSYGSSGSGRSRSRCGRRRCRRECKRDVCSQIPSQAGADAVAECEEACNGLL